MTKPDDPRATYIALATERFAALGYHGASLAEVARAAGVTKQALLHFFGTKERLYAAVLEDLSARQRAQIAASHRSDPAAHLAAYFESFRQSAQSSPDDMRLVVRALLDSDASARTWPMKPYLDTLIGLAKATRGGASKSDAEVLAWISQMIGMVQYMAISAPAVSGMYGAATARMIADETKGALARVVEDFTR